MMHVTGRMVSKKKIQSVLTIIAIISIFLLQGCDRRPFALSDQPFSVGGIKIGYSKAEASINNKFLSCDSKSKDTAECFVDDREKRYDFLGASVDYAKIKLPAPYEYITEVSFSTKKKVVSKLDVETKWNLKGRCLSARDVDDALKFDSESTAPFVRYLTQIHLIPTDHYDFICVLPSGEFFQYNHHEGSDGHGNIYFLKDIWVRNFEYILRAKNGIAGANEEVDRKLNKEH